MKELEIKKIENITGGGVDKAVAVACAGVLVADLLWAVGLFVPVYGGVLIAANIGCGLYGLFA